MVKKSRKIKRSKSELKLAGADVFALLEAMGGSREGCILADLQKNWAQIAGEDFADKTAIKGNKGKIIYLEVEDSMTMQELCFQTTEILEKINEYLKMEYFTQIKFNIRG